jgi:alpha-methylacyl-CoA racemase
MLSLVAQADALIEGFRPGVMERLGLGPDVCLARNARLVYGRMTGWGQFGPLAMAAGHDINYVSLTGALHAIGTNDGGPVPPLNLVGDYAGATTLAFGIVSGLLETSRSGRGQVIDAAMTDSASLLCAYFYGQRGAGAMRNKSGSHMLSGAAHFYGAFECADGKYVSLGSIEPQFYALLVERMDLDRSVFAPQWDQTRWPELKRHLAQAFKRQTRDHWCRLMEGSDVCFAPVLDWDEAPMHPHNVARKTFVDFAGVVQPAPAPRFSRTPGTLRTAPARPGEHTGQVLADWGFSAAQVDSLRAAGAI